MKWQRKYLPLLLISWSVTSLSAMEAYQEPYTSQGRQPDNTLKAVAEIFDSQKREVPLALEVKSASAYSAGERVEVTVMVTNLFDTPLLINRRMLINHPRLEGEVSFKVTGPDGNQCQLKRLVTPMSLSDEDFVTLERGQSIQRTIDLSDFYGMKYRGMYQVRAFYHNDQDHPIGGVRAWKGVIASDPVDVRLN